MTKKIAEYLPARARAVVYSVIGAAVALEAVWDLVPEPIEGKVLQTVTVLGFGLALTQTPVKR